MVESASLKMAKEALRRANESLERHVAERTVQLRESERQFRDVLEALPAAVYTTDAGGRITYYNEAASELAGRRPTLGTDEWCVTWRLYWPDGRPMPHDQCPMAVALKENRPIRGDEAIAERPDGTRVPFMAYPTPLCDASGTLVGAVNMLVDITERKRDEALVECQRAALRMLGEGAPLDDVLEFLLGVTERHSGGDMLGSILLLNEAGTHFERGVGASLPQGFNAAVAGVAVSSALGVCCHAVARREPVVVPDFSTDPLWARFADFLAPYGLRAGWSTPIIGANGRVLGTFANYYRHPCDPTPADLEWVELVKRTATIAIERTQAEAALRDSEERLRRLNHELELRVREEVAAREATQARLAHAQRMEALGQLAGGIAHDFNNVIQAVQGGTALIERRPADAEGVRRVARMVAEAAGRGAAITRRLLAFSHRSDLRAEPIDAASLLADMREILAHTLGTGIEVRLEVPPELLMLMADKSQLETVLVNLATNARDAMPKGGTLTLAASPEVLRRDGAPGHPVSLKAGSYVRLSLSDTGTGMDAATLARASEPFFTTKPVGQGTGLGLAMARGFAEQSGGGLHIEAEPGRGTTVKLWLPVAERGAVSSAAANGEAAIVAAAGQTRARVLVVDDDAIVLETLAQQMEAANYAVLTAGSGAAALALLDEGEAVDLIISDLSMRGMDGVNLIREVHRRRPKLPAILLTGFATNAAEIAVSGAIRGGFSLLRKPIDGLQLAERVAALLEARAARALDRWRV